MRQCRCARRPGFSSSTTLGEKNKRPLKGPLIFLAEKAGFEPAVRYKRTLAFQASALSRSATSPYSNCHVLNQDGIDSRLRRSPLWGALCASKIALRFCRTRGTLQTYTRFPSERVNGGRPARRPAGRFAVQNRSRRFCKPLSHLSIFKLSRSQSGRD